MINNIIISDYKSIGKEIKLDFFDRLSFNVMFGKNNSGKSTIFEAIHKFKEVFLYGMRSVSRIEDVKDASYTINFLIDGQQFLYKVILNYDKSDIIYESLHQLSKTTSYVYFVRDQYEITLGEKLEKLFTGFDFERFKTYLYDLRFDRREFLLAHLRIKDFSESKSALILAKLADEMKHMSIINKHNDIHFYTDMADGHYVSVLKLIQAVYPEIQSLQYKEVSLDQLRFNLNRHRYDHLLDEFRNQVTKTTSSNFFVSVYNQFYKLSGKNLEELRIHAIDVHYTNDTVHTYDTLSSGVKSILLLSMIVVNAKVGDMLFIDDLTKDLDHGSMLVWLQQIKHILVLKSVKLIFSTHNMLLFDGQLFDFRELIYVVNKVGTKLYYINDLDIRKDKKLLNLYLEGFFNNL